MKLLDYGDIKIHVNANGIFSANVGGEVLKSEKLSLLQDRIDKSRKASAKKIAVPVVIGDLSGKGFRRGEIIGIHAGNGNYMFRANSRTHQVSAHDLNHSCYDLSPEREQQLNDLQKALEEASDMYEKTKFSYRDMNALDRVRKALDGK